MFGGGKRIFLRNRRKKIPVRGRFFWKERGMELCYRGRFSGFVGRNGIRNLRLTWGKIGEFRKIRRNGVPNSCRTFRIIRRKGVFGLGVRFRIRNFWCFWWGPENPVRVFTRKIFRWRDVIMTCTFLCRTLNGVQSATDLFVECAQRCRKRVPSAQEFWRPDWG